MNVRLKVWNSICGIVLMIEEDREGGVPRKVLDFHIEDKDVDSVAFYCLQRSGQQRVTSLATKELCVDLALHDAPMGQEVYSREQVIALMSTFPQYEDSFSPAQLLQIFNTMDRRSKASKDIMQIEESIKDQICKSGEMELRG